MIVNVINEFVYFQKFGGGIHTAYLNHIDSLKKQNVKVVINALSRAAGITHIHSFGPFAVYKLFTARYTVVSGHALPETLIGTFKGSKYWLFIIEAYLRFFYNSADIVLILNPSTKKKLEALGVRTKLIYLPNSLNTDLFNSNSSLRMQGRNLLAIPSDRFVIVGSGNFIPRKGIEEFIRAAQQLPEYTFVWVGGELMKGVGAETKTINDLLKYKPKNLIITGSIPYEAMPIYYNMADIFFFPSHQDIFPMSVIEAASCGLPLLLRDLEEYKGIFKQNYLSASHTEEFIQLIKKLHDNKDLYERQSALSTALAKEFSVEVIGKRMVDLYTLLLQKK